MSKLNIAAKDKSKTDKLGISFSLSPLDNNKLIALTGEQGVYLKQIEAHCSVKISHRSGIFYIEGKAQDGLHAQTVIEQLYHDAETTQINTNSVHLALVEDKQVAFKGSQTLIKIAKKRVSARNLAQADYLKLIADNDVCFGIGPAGTGKTYLAVACAAQALANHDVERIILARPAVEAGEKLGFLPGDIGQKVDPYLRPLYDALFEMLGVDRVGKLIERGIIELAPLAYMRGRTLSDAFVLLDEAQNTTTEQMKMFLTRIGQGSKMVITGDTTQIDLPHHVKSGLVQVQSILKGVKGVGFCQFKAKDVVRHSLVQRIVRAYEADAEASQSSESKADR